MPPKTIRKTLPDSLCGLLRQIRERIFEERIAPFTERLQSNIRVPNEGFTINRNAVSDIEAKKHSIQFEHLEAYAHTVGVPMGVLTLVSRYQYSNLDEAELVVDSLRDVIQNARKVGRNKLTIDDLRVLGRMINVSTNGESPPTSRDEAESETLVSQLKQQKRRLGNDVENLVQDMPLWKGEPIDPPKR